MVVQNNSFVFILPPGPHTENHCLIELGDSHINGIHGPLCTLLQQTPNAWKIKEEGHAGSGTSYILDNLNTWLAAVPYPIDYIILLIGTNDFLSTHNTTQEIFTNYQAIITAIHAFNSSTQILCLSLPPIYNFDFYCKNNTVIEEFNALVMQHCLMFNFCTYVETYAMLNISHYSWDMIHLDMQGYALIAQQVYDALVPLL